MDLTRTMDLARTPLYEWHVAHGGRMVGFSGWDMPVQYGSIVAEHQATRSAAALFDVSHMGRFRFDGPRAAAFLDSLLTRRVDDLQPGRIRYSLVTNESGGILDDVLVYHLQDAGGNSYYLLVVNAGNRGKIWDWIQGHLGDFPDVYALDVSGMWSMIAFQGPKALGLAQGLFDFRLDSLKYYTAVESLVAGHGGVVSRTGYTGEDGIELMLGSGMVTQVWERLLEAGKAEGVMAAGLGARDTLRLEAAMPLYGHELSEEIDPFTAGLAFAVDLPGRTFPGHKALEQLSQKKNLPSRVGLVIEGKRVPREGYAIVFEEKQLGRVTSGTFSPTLDRPIAMGYVDAAHAEPGTDIFVDIRGSLQPGKVTKLPFYRRAKSN